MHKPRIFFYGIVIFILAGIPVKTFAGENSSTPEESGFIDMTRDPTRYRVYQPEAKRPVFSYQGKLYFGLDLGFGLLALGDNTNAAIQCSGVNYTGTYREPLDFYPGFGLNFRFNLDLYLTHHVGLKLASGFLFQRLASDQLKNVAKIDNFIISYDKWSVLLAVFAGNFFCMELYAGLNADFHLRSFAGFYDSNDYLKGEAVFKSKSPLLSLVFGFLFTENGFNIGLEFRVPLAKKMNDTIYYYKYQNSHGITAMAPEIGFYFKFGYKWKVK